MFDMIILVYGSNEGCQNTTRWPAYRQEMWVGGGGEVGAFGSRGNLAVRKDISRGSVSIDISN